MTLAILSSQRPMRAAPVLVSVVLHVLVALAWLGFPASLPSLPEEPKAMEVEIVPPPPAKAAQEAKPQPEAQQAAPRPLPQGVPLPQLEDGMLAQRSNAGVKGDPAPSREAAPSVPDPVKPKAKPGPVTQNERDLVLSQVLRHWRPPREAAILTDPTIRVGVTVLADGTFGAPFSRNAPYNPGAAIEGWSSLHPDDIRRRTTEAFYRALRDAQPLRLPPELKAKAPFDVTIVFRLPVR